nr:replication protein A 70 kDa DNA-binding subunit D-like [Ipomoea batatas]
MGRIKVVEKSGWVKICSSYDATKLLFNENTLEFVEFRNSLSMQQQTPLKSITSNSTFSYDDPTESPIAATPGKQDEAGNETEAVKRSLLDEFSSTQPSKKKKDVVVKMEDEKEQGDEH